MSKLVALNCGHGTMTNGKWDSGCTYGKFTEAGLMLPITESAVRYLRGSGVKVQTDAFTGNNRNMVADVCLANRTNADIYVSIHCDYEKAPSGTIPLYVSGQGKKLAAKMNKYVRKYTGIKTRGLCKRNDLYELNATGGVACIFECGSIKYDLKKFKNDYDNFGKGIARGICSYLGVKFTGKKK